MRGGDVAGVIFHSDKGSTYTAGDYTRLRAKHEIRQSIGRVGSCFDNAAAESFFSTLEFEVRFPPRVQDQGEARLYIATWTTDTYNTRRRHYACGMKSPVDFVTAAATVADRAAYPTLHELGGGPIRRSCHDRLGVTLVACAPSASTVRPCRWRPSIQHEGEQHERLV